MDVSFIIPHKGREEMLLATLHSILALETDELQLEIIIVSQNVSNSDELEQLSTNQPIRIIRHQGKTISEMRNVGVTHALGQYLAFLDADVALSANWLQVMLATMAQRPNTVLVSAHQVEGDNAPPLEKIRTALSNAELDCAVTFLPGRNLFLKRDTFTKLGGFPEHLVTCEDYYFTERASQLGELFYTSAASYVHLGEDKVYQDMFHKEIWRGQSNLASIKGRTIPLREWPSFIVPPALLALLLLTVISAALGAWSLSALGLLLFFMPVAAYSWRLKRLVGASVPLSKVLQFYSMFFPARAIGTLSGALKEVKTTSHG
ncbi:glycosyltransferase family 2 protein [Neiella sp. HB171785]|uniref:Glycosyltransferase family 2 protein n=1 Tax=Neiella litorisoli TaxID=2771431 RepID=A0A8J6QLV1_9GAMM|nr:glycosyltransferase family A protein [Neiella litorisoli]MBD1390536.1 glycosyltransferase family 2 protein [Neiella litorisoli]